MSRQDEWATITLILLLAATLRLWQLGQVPPGLGHDEVTNTLVAQDILNGHHAVFVTAGWGRETLYHYVQAATVALFGDHWVGVRYPSVAFGMLGLATIYVLARRLFDAPVALLTIGWLAFSFWPLLYARVALRAISLPVTGALSAYFLLRATSKGGLPTTPTDVGPTRAGRFASAEIVNWVLAGTFTGLSLYTYTSSRILPVILALFLAYRFLFCPGDRIPWGGFATFLLTATLISAPLVAWLMDHPGAEYRITEVREPLDRLLAGDPSLVWQNLLANLKFFTVAGDPWQHYNYLRRPVFADPISALLFYAGALLTLWRWRRPQYGFLIIWLLGALGPSVVTAAPPSSVRSILGLAVVFVFPALGLAEAGRWVKRTINTTNKAHDRHTPSRISRLLFPAICAVALAPGLFLTVRDYFLLWPRGDVVRFFYQTDLTAVAHRIDELTTDTPIAVAGLSVHALDLPTLDLSSRRDVSDIRLCDTRETLVLPSGQDIHLFIPQIVPIDSDLQERLLMWGATVEQGTPPEYSGYRLHDHSILHRYSQQLERRVSLPDGTLVTMPVSFGGHLTFLGYEWLHPASTGGDTLTLLTYWRVEEPPSNPHKIFIHLTGESDIPVAQHDGLGSPPQGWSPGDVIIQKHTVALPANLPSGRYRLQMGVYDALTNTRLPVLSADRVLLSSLEVAE